MHERFDKAIIVGDACVDVHLSLEDMLTNDEKKDIPYHVSGGGTSANTAVALAKLGIGTAFLGTIGSDYGGRFITDEFIRCGIDTSLTLVKPELNTVCVFALIEKSGERHLWGFPRQDVSYVELDLDAIDLEKVRTASWLHSSGMACLFDGNIRQNLPELFRIAHEAGVPTSFDLNTRVSDISLLDPTAVDAIRRTLPYVDYLTGSGKDEFVCFRPCDDWKDSVRWFAKDGRAVIARMAEEGSFTVFKGKEETLPAYDVEVRNTTGAGDTFNAGLIAGLLEGKDVFEAARMGNAVAGYKVSGDSSRHTPDRETLSRFMEETPCK